MRLFHEARRGLAHRGRLGGLRYCHRRRSLRRRLFELAAVSSRGQGVSSATAWWSRSQSIVQERVRSRADDRARRPADVRCRRRRAMYAFWYVVRRAHLKYRVVARMEHTYYRIAKTLETLRSGNLPIPGSSADKLLLETIRETTCSGCSEPIRPRDKYYSIRLRDGTFRLFRFHPVCHELWIRFRRV